MWVRAAGQTWWHHKAVVDYGCYNEVKVKEKVAVWRKRFNERSFVLGFARHQVVVFCFSRYPGILSPSAQGYHRVCWTEDRCLSEFKRGGKRHPFLPPHRTSPGRNLLFSLSAEVANLDVSDRSFALFHVFVVNQYPGCACVCVRTCTHVRSPKCVWSLTPFSLNSDFTLASTTGGKDLGLPIGIELKRRPALWLFNLLCGLLCFCFSSLIVLVWHTQSHIQSAMEAKGPGAFWSLCILPGFWLFVTAKHH